MNILTALNLPRYSILNYMRRYVASQERLSNTITQASVPISIIISNSPHVFYQKNPTIQVRYINNQRPQQYPPNHPRLHGDIEFPNFDFYRKEQFKNIMKTKWNSGDEKPSIAYIVTFFGLLGGAYSLKSDVYFFVSYMSAAADVLALSMIEVNLSSIPPGGCLTFKWRGKPLFVKNRTDAEIEAEATTPMQSLRDPQTQDDRCVKPDWLVVIGVCTHLGCVPIPNTGDWVGGFYCPCHGSHYDNIGRARKGPAPLNLEVPPYKFIGETTIVVG